MSDNLLEKYKGSSCNPPNAKPTMRTIHIDGNVSVEGNLAVGGATAVTHENAQQGRALSTTGMLHPSSEKTKSQVDIKGKVAAKSMHVDVQNSVNVRYADASGSEANREGAEFYRRVMKENEDALKFAADLRVLAVQYAIPDDILLGQFVHGLRDDSMKQKLRNKQNLSIDRAVGLVEAWLENA